MKSVSKAIESSDNYIKFPDGKLIIFDQFTIPAKNSYATYYFPIRFISSSFVVSVSFLYSTEPFANVSIGSKTNEFLQVHGKGLELGNEHDLNTYIIAIGHWK